MREDEFFGTFESMIEIEGSDDRLESIGEDIWILMSLRIVLSTRDLYRIRKMESMSNLSQIATTHECGADICELSLRLLRKLMK